MSHAPADRQTLPVRARLRKRGTDRLEFESLPGSVSRTGTPTSFAATSPLSYSSADPRRLAVLNGLKIDAET